MNALSDSDLAFAVRRLPTDIRSLLTDYEGLLFVGGGFIRAVIAGEKPSDIDIFGPSKQVLEDAAKKLAERRGENTRLHTTRNAITVISMGRITIQFITRWTFSDPRECARSFDFTICQAVIWRGPNGYASWCPETFYTDLAARRLVYTMPSRDEEAGGSLMRVLKFTRRGYNVQVESLGRVVARLAKSVRWDEVESDELRAGQILTGLLREVDPSMAIDGLDVHDDHETPIDGLDIEGGA